MKRLITALSILIALAMSSHSQHRVVVNTDISGTGYLYAEDVFNSVVESLRKIGFLELMGSNWHGTEEGDFQINIRVDAMIRVPVTDNDSKYSYRCKIPYQLSIVRLSDNVNIASQSFHAEGLSDKNIADAAAHSIRKSQPKVLKFINDKMPYYGEVLEVSEADGNKAHALYISLGSHVGIEKGQVLEVKQKAMAAGRLYYKTLGKVKIEEVEGEEGSRCKVTDGHEKILKAFIETPEDLKVQTAMKWMIGDWWKTL